MFSSVSAPFCCPTNTIRRPSIRAKPVTIAASSPKPLSPWSSITSSANARRNSSVRGRPWLRASWTRCHIAAFGSAGRAVPPSVPSRFRPSSRSTTGGLHGLVRGDLLGQRRQEADRAEARPGLAVTRHVHRAHEPEQRRDLGPEVAPMDNPIDEAVLEQELRTLEAGRQLLADRAGGDAGAGEADERVRLGQVHVAEDRVGSKDAAGRRVAHDAEVWHPGCAEAFERRARLRELHQGERALLHAGPTGGRDDDERDALAEGVLPGAGDLLAADGPHRAPHEPEVHDADRDVAAVDPAGPSDRGVAHAGCELGRRYPIGVRLLVNEAKRIERLEAGIALGERVRVEEHLEPPRARETEGMAAGP